MLREPSGDSHHKATQHQVGDHTRCGDDLGSRSLEALARILGIEKASSMSHGKQRYSQRARPSAEPVARVQEVPSAQADEGACGESRLSSTVCNGKNSACSSLAYRSGRTTREAWHRHNRGRSFDGSDPSPLSPCRDCTPCSPRVNPNRQNNPSEWPFPPTQSLVSARVSTLRSKGLNLFGYPSGMDPAFPATHVAFLATSFGTLSSYRKSIRFHLSLTILARRGTVPPWTCGTSHLVALSVAPPCAGPQIQASGVGAARSGVPNRRESR